jgi:hypothetical protein
MDLPFEFIEQALSNRHRIMGTSPQEEAPRSSWNTKIVRRDCELCKKEISNLEVHHIQHRASATNGLLQDGSSMNHESNLMVICQTCHDEIHAGTIVVGNLQQTSSGPERVVQHVETPKKKGKWTEEEWETITSTLKKYSSLSLKSIRWMLSSKHEIEISEAVLGKARKGTF